MNKHFTKISLLLSVILLTAQHLYGQCTGGTSAGSLTPTATWQTVSVNGGTYYTFSATAGLTYNFSFCAADGGNTTFDTQITVLDNSGTPVAGVYNDDFCGLASRVDFVCASSGTYRVLVSRYNCTAQTTMGTLAYRVFTPPACPGGLGTGVTAVGTLPYNVVNASTNGQVNDCNNATMSYCNHTLDDYGLDRVYYFTAASTGNVTVTLTNSSNSVSLAAYQGCPLLGNLNTCMGYSFGNNTRTLNFCVIAGEKYYIVVDRRNNNGFTFSLSITAPVATACSPGTVVTIPSLPYSSSGRTTCAKANDITSANAIACGNTAYLAGEDEVFSFTPSSSGKVQIVLSSSAYNTGVFLYESCPLSSYCGSPIGTCIGSATEAAGNQVLCGNVIAGRTYYIVADAAAGCYTYDISVSAPSPTFSGATCANAVSISSLPFIAAMENTACMGNDYSNASPGSCGTIYESGEDRVYSYTTTGPECISITLTGASTNNIGFQVYNACPDVTGTTCIASAGGAFSGSLASSINLPSAGTYYIIVDTWASPSSAEYNLTIASYGGNQDNDQPCSAEELVLGTTLTGDNNCSGGAGEPAAPACWTAPNALNTVWYHFTAPASGSVTVRTTPGSLLNTQIAIYSGACGAGLTSVACNDNAASCSSTSTQQSQVTATGLTPGTVYYVAVDGFGTLTGSFGIVAIDGSTNFPTIYGQECSVPLPVCNDTVSVGDPGFQAFGNYCDFPGGGANCLSAGERGAAWYEIPITANGNLEFTIIPNDWLGAPSTTATDYDFALYKIAGSGAVNCTNIAANAAPVKCNYSFLGVTGIFGTTAGTAPAAYPGFGGGFASRQAVVAGETYLLIISNYSNSLSGFTLIFPTTSPINYVNAPDTVFWTGSTDTDWFKQSNWGGCAIPSCVRSAVILPTAANQPIINGVGAATKSINIQPGASLTINSNRSLSVCSDFVNDGTLNTRPNSTIIFNGTGTQLMSGNLSNTDDVFNIQINKTAGFVLLENDLDVSGNFTFSTATSTFNGNGKTIRLNGNFSNSIGGTFTPGAGGLLQFSGAAAQTYQNNGDLENVSMVHSGPGVTTLSNMNISTTGSLLLTSGRMITGSFEVNVKNDASSAVDAGNTTSFVQGFLRRKLPASSGAPRIIDFPVGHATPGYQRMNISTFNGSDPAIQSLRVHFTPWAAGPPAAVGADPSCPITYNVTGLNNGYWTVTPQGSGSADMHMTLYNRSYSNASSAFTIMRFGSGSWGIPVMNSGSCTSVPVTAVLRTGISQTFTSGTGILFGTAQGSSTLPVNLLSFTAEPEKNNIICTWTTASEVNNKGFEVLRATDPDHFTAIGWVEGNGTTNEMKSYSFTDNDVQPSKIYYYRLRQVDYDGQTTLTRIVACIIKDNGAVIVEAYPNPYRESTTLRYMLSRPALVTIEITDVTGKIVKRYQQGLQDAGMYTLPFAANNNGLTAGVYTISVFADDQRYQLRLNEQD